MNTSRTLLYTLIIPAFLLQAQSLHMFAQWSHDPTVNTPICTAVNSQIAPAIVSDGTGGAIITWNDQRFSSYGNNYVYAQRVDASGAARWVLNGVSICNAGRPPITPIPPAIVTDDSGGAIIVWHDFRFQWTIYAQRISSAGVTQWQSDGVAVSFSMGASPAVQFCPIVAADGKGGAIVCWQAFRNG